MLLYMLYFIGASATASVACMYCTIHRRQRYGIGSMYVFYDTTMNALVGPELGSTLRKFNNTVEELRGKHAIHITYKYYRLQ